MAKQIIKNRLIILFFLVCYNLSSCQSNVLNPSQFYTDSIYSEHLSEYRKHNIYLPENYEQGKSYPIIYATDGGEITDNNVNIKTLDSLIHNKIIQPVIYIESYCNRKIADSVSLGTGEKRYLNYRNYEYVEANYVEGVNPIFSNSFRNHMLYFKDELIPSVERKLKIKVSKKDRAFYGFSNGAGFGLNLSNRYPELIEHFICFSTLGSNVENLKWDKTVAYPKLSIKYGNEEPTFFQEETEKITEKYKSVNAFYKLDVFNGGHDYKKWNEEFAKSLIELFND